MNTRLDATVARRWLELALSALASARPRLDALNVFPVADADTGTNVVLTLSAGARSAQLLGEDATLGDLSRALADGALWGARGNSGVILAQSLQALARTFAGRESAGGVELIRAFDAVAQGAYSALATPVEGTIVTVARDVAGAVLTLRPGATVTDVAATAVRAGHVSLATTSDILPELRDTGMVDAGALAFVILVETLAASLGAAPDPHPDWLGGALATPADHGPLEGFEVMYLVRASHRQATTLRMHLSDVGNSVVVVQGSGELWHVHVHLYHPAEALSELEMSQVCVRRLDSPRRAVGLVAATTAPHLLEPLAQAGAVAVLRANASTISRAVVDTGAADVIVLPCSAQAAEDAAAAKVDPVVVADGISVSIAPTHHDLAVYEAVGILEAAGEWTRAQQLAAVRDLVSAETIHTVANGDMGALETEVHELATRLVALRPAVVSVLAGGTVGARRAARQLTALVSAANPAIETFIVVGGQPEPALVVSAQ